VVGQPERAVGIGVMEELKKRKDVKRDIETVANLKAE
jgi:hypothetical protein